MKWYCEDCSSKPTESQSNPCPGCCGFTAMDDNLRGEIGEAVARLAQNPILDFTRAVSPEFAANMTVLEDVAAGDRS